MHNIGENIKVLRLAKGWTQQQLAEQLHVTRQAVGHYESGRTQPDIDTCRRLAEIFAVELDVVLDGQEPPQKGSLPRWLLGLVLGSISLFTLARSLLLWAAGKFYAVPEGPISAEMMPLVEKHFALTRAAETVEKLGCTVFLSVLIVWIVQELRLGQGVTWKQRIVTGIQLLLLGILVSVPWGWMDPMLTVADYFYPVLHSFVRYCLAMVLAWGIRKVQKR